MATFAKSTFNAASYAAFRPTYPPSLYNTVLAFHQGQRKLCIDLGSGPGLVARYLSKTFDHVIGTDPSNGMVKQAQEITLTTDYPNVSFREAYAEDLRFLENGSVDMVVAGQAAHWFDYPKHFPEVKRIVRKGGTLAYWGYKDCVFPDYPNATRILNKSAYGESKDTMGPYWSRPGRTIVENKLRDIHPPLEDWADITRVEYEPGLKGPGTGEGTMFLQRYLKVKDLANYIRTWSSYHGWQETHPSETRRLDGGPGDIVDRLLDEIKEEEEDWREESREIVIEWGSGILMARRK